MAARASSTGSQSALREANAARILSTVRQYGGITQVELADATGLSPATVSTIVKQLLAAGTVETRNTVRSGRRAQLVTLAHRAGVAVGVHIGTRTLRVAIADMGYELLDDREMPLPPEHRHDTTLDRAALLIHELVGELGTELSEVQAIGVAVPAPVDPLTGTITVEGVMRGWEDVPLAETFAKRLGRPAVADNEANLAALAEARFGAGRGARQLLYVHAAHTTRAGLLFGGEVVTGASGIAGEIGHTLVDPRGRICRCGSRGCLDTVVGADALADSLRSSRGAVTLADIIRLTRDGDPGCGQVVSDAGETIGMVVANLAIAMNPDRIVVGGDLALTEDVLLEPIRTAISRRVPLTTEPAADVRAGELARDATIKGALARAADIGQAATVER